MNLQKYLSKGFKKEKMKKKIKVGIKDSIERLSNESNNKEKKSINNQKEKGNIDNFSFNDRGYSLFKNGFTSSKK